MVTGRNCYGPKGQSTDHVTFPHSDASSGVKKTRAAHSFFQRLTTYPREIFFISKITR